MKRYNNMNLLFDEMIEDIEYLKKKMYLIKNKK